MNKTKIEWCDYTVNPVKGLCPMACDYCYARAMYKRFKWNPEIRVDLNTLLDTGNIREPSRIFVGSTMELFGDWVKPYWLQSIFDWVKTDIGYHTYIFLTKQPQNLLKWSPFPENCRIGVTATTSAMAEKALKYLKQIEATCKFISFEPLHDAIVLDLKGINWGIIGQQTNPDKPPIPTWVYDLADCIKDAGAGLFIKNNLRYLADAEFFPMYRQEPK